MLLIEITFKQVSMDDKPSIIKYATQQWQKWNKKYFKGKLPFNGIYVQKDTKNVGQLGVYYGMKNWIGLNRRLVLAGEDKFNEVLKHEMCHQATIQLDKNYKDHHGPVWAKWMRHCGLQPNRLDTAARTTYMTDTEKAQKEKAQKEKEKALKAKEKSLKQGNYKKLTSWQLSDNTPAQYYSTSLNAWVPGLIICKHDQQGQRWAFISNPHGTGWVMIPNDLFYQLDGAAAKKVTGPDWLAKAKIIRDYYEKKRNVRKQNSDFKKLAKSRWGF